jgi:hypothetical protein
MTPNGALLFGLLVIAAALLARNPMGLCVILVVVLIFALASGQRIWHALAWSAGIVAPLAAFMALVWIGIVGRAPQDIAAGLAGSREAAALYVGMICLRLLIIAFTVQAAALHFSAWTPLRFVGALSAPAIVKKLLVLTLSLIETIMQAVDRARTALIAAGIITRRHSMRNLRYGWILVQTVWLTVITIALGRTRDKWPIEGTLAHLDDAFAASSAKRLALADLGWLALATASLTAAIGLR